MNGISESTIRNRKRKLVIEPDWRPWKTHHGRTHIVFTDLEEESIKDYIVQNFLKPGYVFTNEDFIDIAMNAYLSKFPNDIENDEAKQFTISHQFIADFKKRNHLSSRSLHAKRRPTATEDDMNQFINEIKNLMDSTDHSHIVNRDETAWKIFPNGMVTWAEKGSDSISINLEASPKTSMTVLASIRADGSKIPLFFIAKGKTNRCKESQIGDVSYHMSTYTENGWTTEETFSRYLRFLRTHFNDEEEIHLLLDSYKVHRCQQIQILAASLKITLHFIPPGLTDQLQPLDRRVFGCLKATAKHLL